MDTNLVFGLIINSLVQKIYLEMTLITRLITKERVIFLADGRISYGKTNIPLIENAIKIVKLENCLIGQSGTNDFGPFDRSLKPFGGGQLRVMDTIQKYFIETNTKSVTSEAIDNLAGKLVSTFEPFHNVNTAGYGNINVQLIVSYLESHNKLIHLKIEISKSYTGYETIIKYYEPIDYSLEFDMNLDINKGDFLKLLHEASNTIYKEELNSNIINNMTDEEISEFGAILYNLYDSLYKNPTVGPFYIHGDLICQQT